MPFSERHWLFNEHQWTNKLAYLVSQENPISKNHTDNQLEQDFIGSFEYLADVKSH